MNERFRRLQGEKTECSIAYVGQFPTCYFHTKFGTEVLHFTEGIRFLKIVY
jgi:hypothetical protein